MDTIYMHLYGWIRVNATWIVYRQQKYLYPALVSKSGTRCSSLNTCSHCITGLSPSAADVNGYKDVVDYSYDASLLQICGNPDLNPID